MEGKLGGQAAALRYVDAIKSISQMHAAKDVQAAAASFFDSAANRLNVKKESRALNEDARIAFSTRLQPVCDLALARVDAWLEEMRKRGIKFTSTNTQIPAVMSQPFNGNPNSRYVKFESGHTLEIQLIPAVVEGGKLVQQLHFQFPFRDKENRGFEVWAMDLREDSYFVRNQRPSIFRYQPFEGKELDPIQDSALISAIGGSLDEVFGYVIEETSGR